MRLDDFVNAHEKADHSQSIENGTLKYSEYYEMLPIEFR